ncbi:MAG: hypothetical protein JXA23_09625 [Bacteroidales bacterium]|nr:hypothetical protein [Bacteroidales bacterium]
MRAILVVILPAFAFVILGCTATRLGSDLDSGTIGLDFTFQKFNMCFGPSPEIRLTNLPDGTTNLNVSLRDLDHPVADHGGGYLKNFSGSVIPAGALEQYQGPCPSMDDPFRPHYVFKVEALDATGKVIAFGQKMKQCGWQDFQ